MNHFTLSPFSSSRGVDGVKKSHHVRTSNSWGHMPHPRVRERSGMGERKISLELSGFPALRLSLYNIHVWLQAPNTECVVAHEVYTDRIHVWGACLVHFPQASARRVVSPSYQATRPPSKTFRFHGLLKIYGLSTGRTDSSSPSSS